MKTISLIACVITFSTLGIYCMDKEKSTAKTIINSKSGNNPQQDAQWVLNKEQLFKRIFEINKETKITRMRLAEQSQTNI